MRQRARPPRSAKDSLCGARSLPPSLRMLVAIDVEVHGVPPKPAKSTVCLGPVLPEL